MQESEDKKNLTIKRTGLLKEAYTRYLEINADVAPYAPPAQRLAHLEPFRTAIYDTPEDQDAAAVAVFENFDHYRPVIDSWRSDAEEVLRKLLPGRYEGKVQVEATLSDVHRPTAGFKCTRCMKECIFHPETLTHGCLYLHQPQYWGSREDPNVDWDFNEGPWKLQYNHRVYGNVRYVTDAYGFDWKTVTCKELDEADGDGQILECQRCSRNWLRKNWREAVCPMGSILLTSVLNMQSVLLQLAHEVVSHSCDGYGYLTDVKWKRHPAEKLPELQSRERMSVAEYADYYSL